MSDTAQTEPTANYGTLDDYRAELTERLGIAHQVASAALRSTADTRKERQAKNSRYLELKLRDRVYLQATAVSQGIARKFATNWVGPFRVVETLSTVTVRIRNTKPRDMKVVHVYRLRHAVGKRDGEPDEIQQDTQTVTPTPLLERIVT